MKAREFWINFHRNGADLLEEWPPKEPIFTIGPREVVHVREVLPDDSYPKRDELEIIRAENVKWREVADKLAEAFNISNYSIEDFIRIRNEALEKYRAAVKGEK